MRVVSIEALGPRLAHDVALARDGERVLLTDGDRVVAELAPPREQEAARPSWLSPATRRGIPPRRPVAPTAQLLDELADDRAGR